ncbi:helix-turn-helix domain-containing protein [Actinokineospora diospyrosa]|uniref:Helix-turn-helix domain-containing protein n=1 Tax=Actinokineospora diospyrosa TaxID=103728 RepID=A0ABT1I9P3_9PSEU|nr:helix-turn-helix transcriptional regulator [Actinokineospora diospyrosa]MCP2269256.1 Helix-turn-helix domain-containing protein [Actinokineospora diospyrosa]
MTDDRTGEAGQDQDAEPSVVLLAEEIRRLRKAADLSHAQLATMVGYSRQYVSLAERPRKGLPSADLVRALDGALAAGGSLMELRERAELARQARRGRSSVTALAPVMATVHRAGTGAPQVGRGPDDEVAVQAPAGRFFAGTTIPAVAFPVSVDARVLAAVPQGFADGPFVRRPRRGLVIGVGPDEQAPVLYGLDTRQARRRLAGAPEQARLLMTRAYALDDLTLGVLWAIANIEEALLDDDALLEDSRGQIAIYADLPRSAVGKEIAHDLGPVSRMWLGSHFCASHILRHTDSLTGTPAFWTREQRGEEASTWLLFAHKYSYLRESRAAGGERPTRVFCIPPDTVKDSDPAERILLLLAAALMESFGITVAVTTAAEYTALPGFVFDGHRNAIVANWVGADGVWQVDVTDTVALVREFADATGYAQAHSVLGAETPGQRLRALADYLALDWTWLARRCAEIGEYGISGLAAPRSRLVSTEGVDQACRFVATVAQVAS